MKTYHRARAVNQPGRLLLLYMLREHELLGDKVSQAEIARSMDANHSTVHTDLRVMDDMLEVSCALLVIALAKQAQPKALHGMRCNDS